ncbi:GNAT family N-acetyltransferase [Emticicia agri]|uniref:N-acetyltransferase n=1 Tax=Emticicia agri TaxID=2492393 RepID=A0A4Q5LTY8_9BACT|nr:GNAT family N-acetyltransferase [Emticicia agri]RYU92903.1 N-acetyltransferase [Emticicia agri]
MRKAKVLDSARLNYVPLSATHVSQTYADWINDPEVNKYLETRQTTLEQLEDFVKGQEKKDILFWAIQLKDSNKHIGNIKIDPINDVDASGEYGILMGDKSEWKKGYAQEASERIIKFCFDEFNLSKITLGVVEENTAAVNLYKRLGFEIYQIKENSGVYEGKLCNTLRMELKK